MQKSLSPVIDLTKRKKRKLDVELMGVIQAEKKKRGERVNWDKAENAKLRERIYQSWQGKNDMYHAGESYTLFCKRCCINRNVLSRYIKRKEDEEKYGKRTVRSRGKPSLLPKSVMRHLCEGWLHHKLICVINI